MSHSGSAEGLGAVLDELERRAADPLVEWNAGGPSYLASLAEWAEAARPRSSVLELLHSAAVERGVDEDLREHSPAGTLLVFRPHEWTDPDALLRLATARMNRQGRLLLHLGRGRSTKDQGREWSDRLRAEGFRIRTERGVGADLLLIADRRASRPKIALLPDTSGACVQIRTLGPLEQLESHGAIELCVLPKEADASMLADRDLLILQRFGGLPAVRLMLDAREMGVPVALDLDDDFFNMPWYNPGARGYGSFEVQVMLRALLRGADAVVTSTPYLQRRMTEFSSRVLCMHNLVDTQLFVRRSSPFDEPGVTTFGYIGTRTHEEDFRPLLGPLRRLLLESAGRVRAVFIGHVPDELRRLPHVRYLGWFGTYQNAASALARCGANVALAPLMDVEFNRSKSAMKYLEYGACAIPGIFSDVEAYNSFVRNGDNGLLVRGHDEDPWERALRFTIDNPLECERMAGNAYDDVVRNHSILSKADEFLTLYRGVIDAAESRTAASPVEAPSVVPQEQTAALTLSLDLDGEPKRTLPFIAALIGELPQDTQLIVNASDRTLATLLRLSGMAQTISPNGNRGEPRRNGVGQALELARGDRLLHLEGHWKVRGGLAERLAAHLGPDVGAVGPRILSPSSAQSVHAILGDRLSIGANVQEALTEYSAARPVTPARWLDPHCVLLDRRAVAAVGGLDDGLIWEDALVDLCLRLSAKGYRVLVANDTYVEPAPGRSRHLPRAWRRDSRRRLAAALLRIDDEVAREADRDSVRLYGTRGEQLDVWVLARRRSPYLMECLERLDRHGEVPFRLHVLHLDGDARSARLAREKGARPHALGRDETTLLERLLRRKRTSHALLLHDGVMATPGFLRELLIVMLGGRSVVVAPFSNDGSAEQRMTIDRSLSLDSLDPLIVDRVSRRTDRQVAIPSCGGFCVLLDLAAVRRGGGRALDVAELVGLRGRTRVLLASRAYAHVLSHPAEAAGLQIGAWPGGPFDLSLPSVEELSRSAPSTADPAAFVGRIRPLVAAMKHNPGDARTLACIGTLYLAQGDLQNAMSFLDRARRIDPFSLEVRSAADRARNVLDASALDDGRVVPQPTGTYVSPSGPAAGASQAVE